MTSLAQKLSGIVGDAFESAGLDRSFGRVTVSDRADLAQFQCNGAMPASKSAKKNPREVASAIVEILQKNPIFSKVDIAGPGFINLNVTDDFLSSYLKEAAADDRAGIADSGKGQTTVLDYGGPNIAKAMHVGHLRSAIIGESVRRTLKFIGYKTLGDIHVGDWGTNLGMLIDNYMTTGESSLITDADITDPATIQKLVDDMAERYPRAATEAKENPEAMDRARATALKLQNKEQPYYGIWEKIRKVSFMDMEKNYSALDVHFDLWKGEADVHDYIAPMVDDLRSKGYAVESDGAWVFPVARNDDKKEVPPLILYKRDGAVMYGTTDLATILERMKLYNPAKIVYIVDQRQGLHFEQLFRAAHTGGVAPEATELTFAGFGTMNGTDGKPFKTRAGGVMRLDDLIQMAIEKAKTRMAEAHVGEDVSPEEQADIAKKVAIAAIKFADLQNARQADYIFDLDRLTSFEGKTGPYLLYQAVRIKSLLRKAEWDLARTAPLLLQDVDRPLALMLTELPDSVEAAAKNYAPHYLCDYAYRLSQAFSSFYGNCHILSEEDKALRESRLTLCAQTYRTLELVLNLLGIAIPERM
ncbi:MAG: arginine--tRNA ligase [Micavibrio aeruginosavorus]|uniref:Arginine--tRNA ligase n=1 Tax=Micavibrio aeruginosavorus TaxID=349221 RepID=A0A2W5N0N3_9BACT|nr:MAG: arginine--tRNA ligase [Micavibrio aeruginosavorus]